MKLMRALPLCALLCSLTVVLGASELCAEVAIPATPVLCSATSDVLMVVDASDSVKDIHSEMTQFMQQFSDLFMLDPSKPQETPRVGLITFNGPQNLNDFSESDAATVLVPLTDEAQEIRSALNGRPMSQGLTCISCGLKVARDMLKPPNKGGMKRPNSLGVVVILTDGSQTVGGTNADAISYADNLRDDGHVVFTIGFGEAEKAVMEALASSPPNNYALAAYGQSSARAAPPSAPPLASPCALRRAGSPPRAHSFRSRRSRWQSTSWSTSSPSSWSPSAAR